MKDQIIKFLAYNGKISVVCSSTTNLVEEARKLHDLSPLATAVMGRVLTITALIGSEMKNKTDKLRYEKVKFKNEKLKILPSISIETNECTDVLVNGLGFIRITKPGEFKIYALDEKMISIRKSMI